MRWKSDWVINRSKWSEEWWNFNLWMLCFDFNITHIHPFFINLFNSACVFILHIIVRTIHFSRCAMLFIRRLKLSLNVIIKKVNFHSEIEAMTSHQFIILVLHVIVIVHKWEKTKKIQLFFHSTKFQNWTEAVKCTEKLIRCCYFVAKNMNIFIVW